MRVLHLADVHLDAAFAGLGAVVSRRRREGIRAAFQRSIDLALQEKVDAVTIAGDLYEDERVRQDTAEFLRQQLARLSCPVLIAPGNHDYWHKGSLYATMPWSENVTVFTSASFTAEEVAGVRVFGVAHHQPKGTPDLLSGVRAGRGSRAIALFHGSERGQMPLQESGKEDHAPFAEEELGRAGFAFGLLGHFHTPRKTQRLVYPGNPEPLTFGEAGERGPVLVDLAPSHPTVEWRRVATFTLEEREVDVSGCQHSEALVERLEEAIPEGQDSGVRLRVVGDLAPGIRMGITELLERLRRGDRCVELVMDARPALDLESLSQAPDARGQFVRALMARPDFESQLVQAALAAGLDALRGEEPRLL
jgi:exonuclease SbcD